MVEFSNTNCEHVITLVNTTEFINLIACLINLGIKVNSVTEIFIVKALLKSHTTDYFPSSKKPGKGINLNANELCTVPSTENITQ